MFRFNKTLTKGLKMLDYKKVVELRKNDNKKFVETLYKNYTFREVFSGEFHFKVTETKGEKEIVIEKFIFLTPAEHKEMFELHQKSFAKRKQDVLDEADRRYDSAKERKELKELYKDPEICMIVNMAYDGEPVDERTFKNACFAIQKNKEIKGMVWKSYLFKGFVTKEQVEALLSYIAKKTA